ncbi:alpha/beta hydrolase fold domain-containing protein [Nocardia transvalensis]|uniref:alpha/beta hydrolase fold domain-containing protein n=1 Tax=Nocardia transvalensis TaxID=37333 RepID=UPI0018949782|nr:alpha/beta hydrolase [Nocardia transvalensis]MBF6328271.1 alpha/beta hydrolase [Nocardia transvalensis]
MLTSTYSESSDGPLVLDLHRPPDGAAAASCPVVVWVHGGGWFTGDRFLRPDPTVLLERGIAVAAIEYRLSGTALFPAQLHDVRAAIRFLRREAGACGLDPRRIGVWGASAGGHLAALAGLTGGIDRLPGERAAGDACVRAVADAYGPASLIPGVVPQAAAGEGWPPEWRLLGGDPARHPDRARAASPLSILAETAVRATQLPDFQIVHGRADAMVPVEHSLRLHEALVSAGARSELYVIDDYGHGFLNPPGRHDVPAGMDDGRLARDGSAPATRFGDGEPVTTMFGPSTVAEFFSRSFALTGDRA